MKQSAFCTLHLPAPPLAPPSFSHRTVGQKTGAGGQNSGRVLISRFVK